MALYDLKMPKTGESVTEGTIVALNVKVGDKIEEDDVLFEINTSKVSAEVPSPVDGKVADILFKEGDTVQVGDVVIRIQIEGDDETTPTGNNSQETNSGQAQVENSEKTEPTQKGEKKKIESDRWYSPVVKSLAKKSKIEQEELDQIPGTGYEGRLSKRDIERYIEEKKGASKPASVRTTTTQSTTTSAPAQQKTITAPLAQRDGDTVIPMDAVRKVISDRMVESVHVSPHVTSVIEVDLTNIVRWREKQKDAFRKKEGINLTYMAPILQATAKALKQFPRVNASVDGYNMVEHRDINIGIAVSLNDGNLIVPVVKASDRLSISGLAHEVSNLASKARANRLSMEEITGGTFTISNYGANGTLFGTPIINQPEVGILGLGTIQKKPSVLETPEGAVIAIRHKMYLAFSYDHRIIDGALAGDFMRYLAEHLENWTEE